MDAIIKDDKIVYIHPLPPVSSGHFYNLIFLFTFFSDAFSTVPLLVYCVIYFVLTELTVGLNMSAGLFLPSLLIGAAWGRMASVVIHHYTPDIVSVARVIYGVT